MQYTWYPKDTSINQNKMADSENEEGSGRRIRVLIRTRPCLSLEARDTSLALGSAKPDKQGLEQKARISVFTKRPSKRSNGKEYTPTERADFHFDDVVDASVDQAKLYRQYIHSLVGSTLEGYNATVLAYGQTGAGKTFTISGSPKVSFNDRGITPRALSDIFSRIRLSSHQTTYAVRVSYLEIYNEQYFDLLANTDSMQDLSCMETETPNSMPLSSVKELRKLHCATEEEALQLLFLGEMNRAIASHQLNESSTRSHCIFTIYVAATSRIAGKTKHQELEEDEITDNHKCRTTTSKINFVDLAGSERSSKTGSHGKVMKESLAINKSLSFLQQVVLALADKHREHIPFRQSKLTQVLRDSLGGNCRTLLLACIWPEKQHHEQTMATLRFATRMRCIQNKPTVNQVQDSHSDSKLIKSLRKQVKLLRAELAVHDQLVGMGARRLPELDVQYEESQLDELSDAIEIFVEAENNPPPSVTSLKQVQMLFRLFKRKLVDARQQRSNCLRRDTESQTMSLNETSFKNKHQANGQGNGHVESISGNSDSGLSSRKLEVETKSGKISSETIIPDTLNPATESTALVEGCSDSSGDDDMLKPGANGMSSRGGDGNVPGTISQEGLPDTVSVPVKHEELDHTVSVPMKSEEIDHTVSVPMKSEDIDHTVSVPMKSEEIDHTVLVPMKSEEMDHTVLVPVKSEEMDHTVSVPMKSEEMDHTILVPVKSEEMDHSVPGYTNHEHVDVSNPDSIDRKQMVRNSYGTFQENDMVEKEHTKPAVSSINTKPMKQDLVETQAPGSDSNFDNPIVTYPMKEKTTHSETMFSEEDSNDKIVMKFKTNEQSKQNVGETSNVLSEQIHRENRGGNDIESPETNQDNGKYSPVQRNGSYSMESLRKQASELPHQHQNRGESDLDRSTSAKRRDRGYGVPALHEPTSTEEKRNGNSNRILETVQRKTSQGPETESNATKCNDLLSRKEEDFDKFKRTREGYQLVKERRAARLEYTALRKKMKLAKSGINASKREIDKVVGLLHDNESCTSNQQEHESSASLLKQLGEEKQKYKKRYAQLQDIKKELLFSSNRLSACEVEIKAKFDSWQRNSECERIEDPSFDCSESSSSSSRFPKLKGARKQDLRDEGEKQLQALPPTSNSSMRAYESARIAADRLRIGIKTQGSHRKPRNRGRRILSR